MTSRWRGLRCGGAEGDRTIALLVGPPSIVHNAVSTVKTLAHVVSHGPHCLDGVAAAVAVARYQAGRADVQTRFASNSEVDAVLRGARSTDRDGRRQRPLAAPGTRVARARRRRARPRGRGV